MYHFTSRYFRTEADMRAAVEHGEVVTLQSIVDVPDGIYIVQGTDWKSIVWIKNNRVIKCATASTTA